MTFEISRRVQAPIERAWQAWTTVEDLERWYSPGPVDWVIDTLDVRPGGAFRMRMPTPDGEHVAEGAYEVVDAPVHLRQGPSDGSMVIDTRLAKVEDGTEMVVTMEGLPDDKHDMMQGAWSAGFDKLQRLLE